MSSVVEVTDLRTYFYLDDGVLKAVDGVSFAVDQKRTLGIIGESGCGKSVTAQSILRIVPTPGQIVRGQILLRLEGRDPIDLAAIDPRDEMMRSIRGRHISMIFQEPMTSLSPVHRIGDQIMEAILLHRTPDKVEARQIAGEMLERVGIGNPQERMDEYPHQFSGGMRQRAMIAMALSCHPQLLIADEPTTALDVTVQAQILELMKELQELYGMSILYITHDLGVIAEIADEVAVMYLGRVVEQGTAEQIFNSPLHPYTRGLLKSVPMLGRKARVRLDAIEGTVPVPINPPWRCGFWNRCPDRMAGRCDKSVPALIDTGEKHGVRCFLHREEEEEQLPDPVFKRRRAHHAMPVAGGADGGEL